MLVFSTFVGEIPEQDKTKFAYWDGDEDEKYIFLDAEFDGVPMQVCVSEYVWRDEYFGRVKVVGYISSYPDEESTGTKKKQFNNYFKVHTIEKAEDDEKDCSVVQLQARITRVGDFFS